MGFVIRVVVTAVALWIATLAVRGITVTGGNWQRDVLSLLAMGLIVGLANAVIKPIIKVVGCPVYVLTLGLVALLVNAGLLLLASWVAGRFEIAFHVAGFGAALWGAVVVSVVSWALNLVAGHST